jgi:hypothetical protein
MGAVIEWGLAVVQDALTATARCLIARAERLLDAAEGRDHW